MYGEHTLLVRTRPCISFASRLILAANALRKFLSSVSLPPEKPNVEARELHSRVDLVEAMLQSRANISMYHSF